MNKKIVSVLLVVITAMMIMVGGIIYKKSITTTGSIAAKVATEMVSEDTTLVSEEATSECGSVDNINNADILKLPIETVEETTNNGDAGKQSVQDIETTKKVVTTKASVTSVNKKENEKLVASKNILEGSSEKQTENTTEMKAEKMTETTTAKRSERKTNDRSRENFYIENTAYSNSLEDRINNNQRTNENFVIVENEPRQKETEIETVNFKIVRETVFDEPVTERFIQSTNVNSGVVSYTDEELDHLAKTICEEGGGGSYKGMLYIGQVVVNRVNSKRFPNTVDEVLDQSGQYDHYTANNGREWTKWATSSIKAQCLAAAYAVLNGEVPEEYVLPSNVVYQAQFTQGSGVYEYYESHYYCFL